jgi:hypothetical protein
MIVSWERSYVGYYQLDNCLEPPERDYFAERLCSYFSKRCESLSTGKIPDAAKYFAS